MRIIILLLIFLFPFSQAHAETKLTLQDCIDTALKNQPALKAAHAGIAAGKGREIQARSPYLPQITASTGYSDNRQLGGAFGDSTTKSYTSTLSANQMIYDFGKTGNAFDAARFGARSAGLDADRVSQDVVLNVKQAYFGLLQAKRLIIVAQKTLEQTESHLKQAQAFFRAGSKPRFDVTRAEVEVNSAKLSMINANNTLRIRTIALYNAMGIEPGGDVAIEDILSASTEVPLYDEVKAAALQNRPEMRKADADIEAARSRVKAAESGYYPTLSANGAYNWAHGSSSMGPNSMGTTFHGDVQDSWNAGITLSVPLFEGGLTKGKVGEARANLLIAEAQRDTLKQSILIELSQAYADMESAKVRIDVMESSLQKARENLFIAQGRYEAGVGPYIEVTDAQVAAVNAETDHVQAFYDYQLGAARLLKAIGAEGQITNLKNQISNNIQ
jgi:outer membrane protein